MRAGWRRLRRHVRSLSDLRLLLAIAGGIGVLPLLMRLPLPQTLRLLERWSRWRGRAGAPDEEQVVRYVGAVCGLNRWSWRDNCVVRSLALYAFLNSAAAPLELRFGVRRGSGPGPALGRRHVWILRNGEPFRENEPLGDYLVLYRYPS